MADAFSDRFQDNGGDVVPGRALVPLTTPPISSESRPAIRPDARFVAQLIATAAHAPQTRLLRRAAPDDAVKFYAGTLGRGGIARANGDTLSQVA
jgi:hypothetical protein